MFVQKEKQLFFSFYSLHLIHELDFAHLKKMDWNNSGFLSQKYVELLERKMTHGWFQGTYVLSNTHT